jgi:hypothetical protein
VVSKEAEVAENLALGTLDQEVQEAQTALLHEAQEQPAKWWSPEELRDAARNGWGADVMMFALTDLVNRNRLEINQRLQVRFLP